MRLGLGLGLALPLVLASAAGAAADPAPRAKQPAPAAPKQLAPASPSLAPPAQPKPPCAGCTLDVYGDATASARMPLLVVLHGDHEQARNTAARWRAAAKQRRWALLSLQCPAAEQCKGSWWQWNGDPQWVRDQIAQVAAQLPIDPDRTYAVGWSGGATYLGMRMPIWHELFAAIVIHGGGQAPREDPAVCPARALPAYFLVGDGNPLHGLARDLRDYFVRCKQDVQWALLPGADHPKEDRALDGKRALTILDWLAARSRTQPPEKR